MSSFSVGHVWFLLRAAEWTLALSAIGFVGGSLLAVMLVLARMSDVPPLRWAVAAFIQLIQGTPLLIQLFICYFGLSLVGANLPPLVAGGIALVANSSVFLAEIWAACMGAIPKGQWESAASLGLTRMQQMTSVIVPQAVRIALPPTTGFLVQLIKNTSLAALIGFVELARGGQLVTNATFEPAPAYLTVGLIYFAICFPLSQLSRILERRLHVGGRTLRRA